MINRRFLRGFSIEIHFNATSAKPQGPNTLPVIDEGKDGRELGEKRQKLQEDPTFSLVPDSDARWRISNNRFLPHHAFKYETVYAIASD